MSEALVIQRGKGLAQYSIIWLHGLGADGSDFEPVINMLPLNSELSIRFVLPTAPLQPVTLNGGMIMRSWYDIVSLDFNAGRADAEGVHQSVAMIRELIAQEVEQGISADRIILAGFSQGGALALATGLTFDQPLAGILALSTYLPISDEIPQASVGSPDIMMMHGAQDDIVGIQYAENSRNYLQSLGYQVDWQTYPMAHSVCEPQITDIANWINLRFQVVRSI